MAERIQTTREGAILGDGTFVKRPDTVPTDWVLEIEEQHGIASEDEAWTVVEAQLANLQRDLGFHPVHWEVVEAADATYGWIIYYWRPSPEEKKKSVWPWILGAVGAVGLTAVVIAVAGAEGGKR